MQGSYNKCKPKQKKMKTVSGTISINPNNTSRANARTEDNSNTSERSSDEFSEVNVISERKKGKK